MTAAAICRCAECARLDRAYPGMGVQLQLPVTLYGTSAASRPQASNSPQGNRT